MMFLSNKKGSKSVFKLDFFSKNGLNLAEIDFYSLSGCSEPDFSSICLEIIQKIFGGETVYTYLESFHQKNLCKQRSCFYAESFAAGYYRFLKAHSLTENVFFDGDSRMISVTLGANQPLLQALFEKRILDTDCRIYAIPHFQTIPRDFQEALGLLQKKNFGLILDYQEQPSDLQIQLSGDGFIPDTIIQKIQQACQRFQKPLEICRIEE